MHFLQMKISSLAACTGKVRVDSIIIPNCTKRWNQWLCLHERAFTLVLTGQNDTELPYHVRTHFPREFWRDYWNLFFTFVLEVPKPQWDMLGSNPLGFPYMSIYKQRVDFIFTILSWEDKVKGKKRTCMRKDKNQIEGIRKL